VAERTGSLEGGAPGREGSPEARLVRRCFVSSVAILFAFNLARGLGVFGADSLGATLTVTAVLAAVAWRAALRAPELGLGRRDVATGVRLGVLALGLISIVLVVGAAMPATRDLFDDARAEVSAGTMLYEVFVSILVGTVLAEEFAFRGVLLALATKTWNERSALLVTSALFGLWHISPTLGATQNTQLDDSTRSMFGEAGVVVGVVVLTFIGGMLFCWLRLRSRSLVAPVLAHFATNATAFVVAWVLAH
jgi:membrane protease YdiL (CAAX protease family)